MGIVSPGCTVVMATFNGAKYVGEQLASLEAQVMRPSRLIVSDDGSSDSTREVVASFAKEASFDVVVVDGPQQGYAENFWSAARLADTKYVAWSDQDDVWHPRKILRCVEALEESGAFFASHSAAVVDKELRPLGHCNPVYRRTRVLGPLQGDPFKFPCGFASVFRRELLSEIYWDARPHSHQHTRLLPHDETLALVAFAFHSRVEISEPLALYRQHGSNSAGDQTVSGLFRISAALKYSADSYARLANCAEEYACYLSQMSQDQGSAGSFFQDAADRARLREKLRNGQDLTVRLKAMGKSVWKGNYRAVPNGGFGFPAFLNDSFALSISVINGRS